MLARILSWCGGAGLGLLMMALPETGWLGQEHAKFVFWAGLSIATISFVGLVVSSALATRERRAQGYWLPMWRLNAINLKTFPFRRLISMKRASQIAYEKTRGTVLADYAEHTARDSKQGYDGILDYYAGTLVGSGNAMELWGRRPPSTRLEAIDGAEEFPQCSFGDGGSSLHRYGDSEPRWTDIMVPKHQLKERIKHIAEYG